MHKKIKAHDFRINGGENNNDGPYHWPDCLNITMRQYKALDIIRQIACSLQVGSVTEDNNITLSFMGKLDYDIDENA